MVDSRFGKPSKFVHLSNVLCSGQETKLADCTIESFSLQDSTKIVDHINVAGVVCVVQSSTTRRSMMPTRSTAPPDQSVQVLHGVVGFMAVLLAAGILLFIM